MPGKGATDKGSKGTKAGAAASAAATAASEAAKHAVVYAISQSEIKDDLPALVACLKSNKGQLTRQEAGFLLLHHAMDSSTHDDLLAAGAVNACVGVLDNASCNSPEASTASGILLMLSKSKDPLILEAVAKGRGAWGVLHKWLGSIDQAGRTAAEVLANLAAEPVSRAALLKASEGDVPWTSYCYVLERCLCHPVVSSVCKLIKSLTHQRDTLSEAAGTAGVLGALLSAASRFKSEATVGTAADCIRALIEGPGPGSAANSKWLILAGVIQVLVDLLGPPPASIIAWEQQQHAHLPSPSQIRDKQQEQQQRQTTSTSSSVQDGAASASQANAPPGGAKKVGLPGSGADAEGSAGGAGGEAPLPIRRLRTIKSRDDLGSANFSRATSLQPTKSTRLGGTRSRGVSEIGVTGQQQVQPGGLQQQAASVSAPKETIKHAAARASALPSSLPASQQLPPKPQAPPLYPGPPLSESSVALKWEGPVSTNTRAAVAGCLWVLAQAPEACAMMRPRLAASRLAVLVAGALEEDRGAVAAGKKPKKKKSGLSLEPVQEDLLTAAVNCLKLLAVADNSDLFRMVATPKALAAIVLLADEAQGTLLRRGAQALAAQATLLLEASAAVEAAQVPEELKPGTVQMRLTAEEAKRVAVEYPGDLKERGAGAGDGTVAAGPALAAFASTAGRI